jgi:probable phosphoglycerate mutase
MTSPHHQASPMPIAAKAEIYLLRHGETEWNAIRRFQGALDSPLTPRGVGQAELCGRALAATVGKVDAFAASPLGRARQTAEIVHALGRYPPIDWDDRLAEVSLGCWDGLTDADIDAGWPGLRDGATRHDWYFRAPDGESHASAEARLRDWLAGLHGTVVAVTHGLVGRILRGLYLDLPKDEALRLPVPQDVIWRLAGGRIEAIAA